MKPSDFEGTELSYYKALYDLLLYAQQFTDNHSRCSIRHVRRTVALMTKEPTKDGVFWACQDVWPYLHGEAHDYAKDRELYKLFSDIYHVIWHRGIPKI